MRHIIGMTLEDYKWLWRDWAGGMFLSHLVILGTAAFLVLVREYQAGNVSYYLPGVPLAVAIACTLLLTAVAYE